MLTSKAGHSVYNITRISNVTSATNTFTWDSTIYNRYIKLEKRYKIFVAATDYRDCLGIQGDFVITIADKTETAYGNVIVCAKKKKKKEIHTDNHNEYSIQLI